MKNRWFHRPSIHSPGHGQEKKVEWLELFYDLIYVATFIQLGNALSHNLSLTGVLGFAGLLMLLWLTWTAFTVYSNRFEVDDLSHRALVFVQMFAIAGMAVCIPAVFRGDTQRFSFFYAAVRIVIVLLYTRTCFLQQRAREMTSRYALGYAVGAALWLLSGFVGAPWLYLCWALAAAIDLGLPLSRPIRALLGRFPPDILHLSERYGLLTLIVLGESFVKVLSNLSETGAGVEQAFSGAMGLVLVCSLWWIYFDDVAGSRIKRSPLAAFVWMYSHLPLTISFVAFGVSVKKAVSFSLSVPAPVAYRWLLCGSLALVFLSVAAIDAVTERRQSEFGDRGRTMLRLLAGLVVLLLAPTGRLMPAWVFLLVLGGVCIAQVLLDLLMAPLKADHQMLHEGAQDAFGTGEEEEAPAEVKAQAPTPILGGAIRKGTPSELRRDLYFQLMDGSWWLLFATLLSTFLLSNAIFAALYLLDPLSVSNMGSESFSQAFYFSVQTMSTIGYGGLSPVSDFANVLVVGEAIFGVFFTAMATGLMFAKASRPRQSILFSKPIIVTQYHGKPTLMFRVGNARGNEIVEASMRVSVLVDETSPEGVEMRRMYDLELERASTPLFVLTWQALHVLGESSPLHGLSADNLSDRLRGIIVTMTGHDATYGQTVHGRGTYQHDDFRFGHRFVDILSTLPDGRLLVDYDKFHKTRPEGEAST